MSCGCCKEPGPIRRYGGCGCCCEDPGAVGPGPEPIPVWNFRLRPSGIIQSSPGIVSGWAAEVQSFTLPLSPGTGAVLTAPFMGTIGVTPQPISFGGQRLQGELVGSGPSYQGFTNAMTWMFALSIPSSIPPGNGPSSTANTPNKIFPLYFKPGGVPGTMVMGCQPATFNCDMATDIASWASQTAIIAIQMGAGLNPRFSCYVNSLGAFQFTATAGQNPIPTAIPNQQNGLSIGGWWNMGGEFVGPTAECSNLLYRASDADIDAEVLWTAEHIYGMAS